MPPGRHRVLPAGLGKVVRRNARLIEESRILRSHVAGTRWIKGRIV